MRRHVLRTVALTSATLLALAALPASADEPGPVEAGVFVDKIEGLPTDFIRGADVSSVLALEESGVVFRDSDGNPADLFTTLADNGLNTVRIRVWNDPFDEQGRSYGGGNNDLDAAVTIGQRATAAGMDSLINFHLSDFWADPAKQQAPKAWADMSVSEKADATYDYVADSLTVLRDAGVDISMVQVGNETNNSVAGVEVGNWEQMAEIFNAGSRAVRDVLPDAQVALHFTNPETSGRYAGYAQQLATHNVDYDVFASSWYPYWHGSLSNLTSVLSDIATTYNKDVMVVETSWTYTLDDGDGWQNTIDASKASTLYPISPQGQADLLHDVMEAVHNVGDAGVGVVYWEPAWLPVGPPEEIDNNRTLWEEFGSGWASSYASGYDPHDAGQWYGGSAVDNQALFTFDGRPLDSLGVFSHVYTGAVTEKSLASIDPVAVEVTAGETITLPDEVTLRFNDGSTDTESVTWDDYSTLTDVGAHEVAGTTSSGVAVTATITIVEVNVLLNPSFEDADLSMWDIDGTGIAREETSDSSHGAFSLKFWNGTNYTFTVSQTLTGLTPGTYTMRATSQGGDAGENDVLTVSATTTQGTTRGDLALNGWQQWATTTVEDVTVPDDGTITVTLTGELTGNAWGTLDNVVLTPTGAATSPDTGGAPDGGTTPDTEETPDTPSPGTETTPGQDGTAPDTTTDVPASGQDTPSTGGLADTGISLVIAGLAGALLLAGGITVWLRKRAA